MDGRNVAPQQSALRAGSTLLEAKNSTAEPSCPRSPIFFLSLRAVSSRLTVSRRQSWRTSDRLGMRCADQVRGPDLAPNLKILPRVPPQRTCAPHPHTSCIPLCCVSDWKHINCHHIAKHGNAALFWRNGHHC
jgi:hypothetical protein